MPRELSFQRYQGPLSVIESPGIHVKPAGNSSDLLVIAVLGKRPTTGYGITIERLVLENDGSITVICSECSPKPGTITAQVITYPAAAVLISSEYADHRFRLQISAD